MKLLLCILTLISHVAAHEAGETEAQVGPGKAIEAFEESKGIKLSDKATKSLEIQTKKMTSAGLPPNALIAIQEKTSVYVKNDGWYRLVSATDVKLGDEVVVRGAALLRVAHINVNTDEGHEDREEHSDEEEHEGEHHD